MYASWLDVLSQNFQPGPLLNRKHPLVTAIGATGWCLKVRSVVNIEDPNPYWFVYAWRYFLLCLLAVGTLWTVIFPCGFPCSFRFNLSGIRDSLRRRESAVQAAQWFSDHWLVFSASASTKIIHSDTKPRGGMESHTTPLSREGSHP